MPCSRPMPTATADVRPLLLSQPLPPTFRACERRPMGCPALQIANPKGASRAIPAPARRASTRGPVSLRRTKEKRHRYGRAASSGSVVGNDPVNLTDPTGMWGEDPKPQVEEPSKVEDVVVRVSRGQRGRRGGRDGSRTVRDDLYALYLRQIREIDPYYSTLRDPSRPISQSEVNALGRDLARLQSGRQRYATDVEAAQAAVARGWMRTSERAHGAAIFRDPSTGLYYSRDTTSHSGGAWKVGRSPSDLQQGRRTGTLDSNLNRIGD